MAAEKHLLAIAREIEALEDRFVSSPVLGMYLKAEDAANFRRLAVEAKSILEGELGHLNNFSSNLLFAAGGISGPDGPSKANVLDARMIIQGAVNHIRRRPGLIEGQVQPSKPSFVASSRLAEIRALPKTKWDFARLIRLCEELNVCYANGCFMATAMLVRSISDHVPPVFGLRSFSEVANNYPGAQSFRGSMKHLDQSLRHIADAHLHVHVRGAEVLPTEAQVPFQADLDVLLAEVVRRSK